MIKIIQRSNTTFKTLKTRTFQIKIEIVPFLTCVSFVLNLVNFEQNYISLEHLNEFKFVKTTFMILVMFPVRTLPLAR